jgi:hypothetical protein
MKGWGIIDEADAVADIIAACDPVCFPTVDGHPIYGTFHRRLSRTLHPDTHAPVEFVVVLDDRPMAVVFATLNDARFSAFGLPICLSMRAGIGAAEAWQCCDLATKHMLALLPAGGEILLRGGAGDPMGVVDQYCAYRQGSGRVAIYGVADLSLDEAGLERQMRRSYRYEVRWGRKNLRVCDVGRENLDRSLFDLVPDFHARVAGISRRDPAHWQVMWDELAAGSAELSLGWLGDELVSATLVVDRGPYSFYSVGVYDRNRFDLPISHWPVFGAMLRAKARGRQFFDFGELPSPGADVSDKEVRIGFFKRGFVKDSRIEIFWTLRKGGAVPEQGAAK